MQTVHVVSRTQSPAPVEGRLIEIDGEEYQVTSETPGGELRNTKIAQRSQTNSSFYDPVHASEQECFIVTPNPTNGKDVNGKDVNGK